MRSRTPGKAGFWVFPRRPSFKLLFQQPNQALTISGTSLCQSMSLTTKTENIQRRSIRSQRTCNTVYTARSQSNQTLPPKQVSATYDSLTFTNRLQQLPFAVLFELSSKILASPPLVRRTARSSPLVENRPELGSIPQVSKSKPTQSITCRERQPIETPAASGEHLESILEVRMQAPNAVQNSNLDSTTTRRRWGRRTDAGEKHRERGKRKKRRKQRHETNQKTQATVGEEDSTYQQPARKVLDHARFNPYANHPRTSSRTDPQ
ncbi:hypothetical protein BJX70DRAFT_324346 [Aspergillus crustosus]